MIELPPQKLGLVLPALRQVPINHLFARSVVEQRVDGRVWANDAAAPTLFHVIHPYGMTLLFGEAEAVDDARLSAHLRTIRSGTQDLWMQASPSSLAAQCIRVLGTGEGETGQRGPSPQAEQFTRANFRFCASRYQALRHQTALGGNVVARPIRPEEFALPEFDVAPPQFWRHADQFLAHGGGWCVELDGQVAAMAFCSFRFDHELEIGIATRKAYRGRGLALHAVCALIDACIADGMEPVWSCRKENQASYRLAIKLGFEPTIELPYFRLPAA